MNARRPLALACSLSLALALAPARAQDEPSLSPATQTAADLQAKADDLLTKQKKFDEAAATYERLLDHLDVVKAGTVSDFPESQQRGVRAHAWYNLACARALAGHVDKALDALERAAESGFFDWQWAEKDADLAPLRESPRFAEILVKLKGTGPRDLEKLVKETISAEPLFDYDFEVTTLDGATLKLADLKGKTVVVDCFGTWCPPCREEIPHLEKLATRAKERGEAIVVVGLCFERADPDAEVTKAVTSFVAETKITYAVALLKEKDPALERIPELKGFPTTLWIDAKGKVRGRVEGALGFEEIDAITRKVAGDEKPKPAPAEKGSGEPF